MGIESSGGDLYIEDKIVKEGFAFDDVLVLPGESSVLPVNTDTQSRIGDIELGIPVVAAAMDRVSEAEMGIALAYEGGIAVIHKGMPPDEQGAEVEKVKRSQAGVITRPITIGPDRTVADAQALMDEHEISGLPVTEEGLVRGIITRRNLRFMTDSSESVESRMTPEPVTIPPGASDETALDLFQTNSIEKLLVVDERGHLLGMRTFKDLEKARLYPNAAVDTEGRLRIGAAVGVGDDLDARLDALVSAGVDMIVVDSAHGHSRGVLDTVEKVKSNHSNITVVGGNVATEEAAREMARVADAVKVGIGAGSICTTRIVSGVGVPQLTAIMDAARAARSMGVEVIADGGIQYSGDIAKALVAGAHVVMLGSVLAATAEAPGEVVTLAGEQFKEYRGMGSLGSMTDRFGSPDRYGQSGRSADKLVPEGIEGRVVFRGPVGDVLYQLVGGLRSAMGYAGARTISELYQKGRFIRITGAGMLESHPHHIQITKDAPNYHS